MAPAGDIRAPLGSCSSYNNENIKLYTTQEKMKSNEIK